jgi:hypothetical protein
LAGENLQMDIVDTIGSAWCLINLASLILVVSSWR